MEMSFRVLLSCINEIGGRKPEQELRWLLAVDLIEDTRR